MDRRPTTTAAPLQLQHPTQYSWVTRAAIILTALLVFATARKIQDLLVNTAVFASFNQLMELVLLTHSALQDYV